MLVFFQTTHVAQDDSLSPVFFSILLKCLLGMIRSPRNMVKTLLYADDLVIHETVASTYSEPPGYIPLLEIETNRQSD